MNTPGVRRLSDVIKELELSPLEAQAAEISMEDRPQPPGKLVRIWSQVAIASASVEFATGGLIPDCWVVRVATLVASPTLYDLTQQGGDPFTLIVPSLATVARLVLPGTAARLIAVNNTAFFSTQNTLWQVAAIIGRDPWDVL